MKQKIFAGIATLVIVAAGVITPLFGFATTVLQTKHASAREGTPTETTPTTGVITSVGDEPVNTGEATGTADDCGQYEVGCKIMVATSQVITSVPFFLATLAGLVSDYAIWYSLQSSTYTSYDGQEGDEGIVVTGWKLVRDFSNLLFIFALFVIAFTLILNLDERADGAPMGLDPKRTIARVIIMALLVNFSFFMGRAVIDITNIVGLTFYNKITVAPKIIDTGDDPYAAEAQRDVTSFYTNAVGIRSITSGILGQINPQRFILQNTNIDRSEHSYGALFFVSIMSAVFGLFLVYLFISIAILFISRTIGLFLAVIISPIAFVSYTIPALQKQSFIGFDDWLKQFFGLAFMAPVFLFFLYISLQFFKISLTAGSGLITMAAQVLVQFLVVGILLIYYKNLAKDLSGKMGTMVTNAVTSVATGAATLAGVAATGGIAGVASFGRRYAGQQLSAATGSAGKAIFGDEKYEAMQTQWKRAGGFSMLKGRGVMSSLKTMNRVVSAGSKPNQFSAAFSQGRVMNRAYDFKQAKELEAKLKKEEAAKKAWAAYTPEAMAKKKRSADIDKEIEKLKKDKDENIITDEVYKDKTKVLNQEKRDLALPEDAQKEKEAKRNLDTAQKAATAAKTDEKLTNTESKITSLTNRISTADAAIKDADRTLSILVQDKADETARLAKYEQELADAKAQQKAELSPIETRRQELLKSRQEVQRRLGELEREQATAKKFNDANSISAIQKERAKLANEETALDRDLSNATYDYTRKKDASDKIIGFRTEDRDASKQRLSAIIETESRANDKKATNSAAKNALIAEKATADSEKSVLESQKLAETAELARLNQAAANAKTTVENNKKIAEINKEIAQRTGVRKTDTTTIFGKGNRQRNQERVETLQERLRNITSGGTPPTPPTTP